MKVEDKLVKTFDQSSIKKTTRASSGFHDIFQSCMGLPGFDYLSIYPTFIVSGQSLKGPIVCLVIVPIIYLTEGNTSQFLFL